MERRRQQRVHAGDEQAAEFLQVRGLLGDGAAYEGFGELEGLARALQRAVVGVEDAEAAVRHDRPDRLAAQALEPAAGAVFGSTWTTSARKVARTVRSKVSPVAASGRPSTNRT
jgi:hypothetical protein